MEEWKRIVNSDNDRGRGLNFSWSELRRGTGSRFPNFCILFGEWGCRGGMLRTSRKAFQNFGSSKTNSFWIWSGGYIIVEPGVAWKSVSQGMRAFLQASKRKALVYHRAIAAATLTTQRFSKTGTIRTGIPPYMEWKREQTQQDTTMDNLLAVGSASKARLGLGFAKKFQLICANCLQLGKKSETWSKSSARTSGHVIWDSPKRAE